MKRILLGFSIGILGIMAAPGVAYAQTADVPSTDKDGNFLTTELRGNRGNYLVMYWLVVDRDPKGLNCRRADGTPVVKLPYGTVIRMALKQRRTNAIQTINGEKWLDAVTASGLSPGFENSQYNCYVRANAKYIAPINPDSVIDVQASK